MVVVADRFDEIWVPRIGADASAALRRSSYVVLIGGPIMVVLAAAGSFAVGSGTVAGDVIGVTLVAVIFAIFVGLIRSRVTVATAISARFGTTIHWWEMPKMREGAFDQSSKWVLRRALVASKRDHAPDANVGRSGSVMRVQTKGVLDARVDSAP